MRKEEVIKKMDETTTGIRSAKVKRIFQQFDLNQDGGLNREEMAALVVAVNPRVKFSDDQLDAINNEVFLTYPNFIDGEKGITFRGLLRTYDDGAGDVDRDFEVLGLDLNLNVKPETVAAAASSSIANRRVAEPKTKTRAAEWAVLLNHTVTFPDTYKLLDDLEILFQKLKSKQSKNRKLKNNSTSKDKLANLKVSEKSGQNYAVELSVLRSRADQECSKEEAFDRHMAMGRLLYDNHLYTEAFISFGRALEWKPTNVISHFRAGICLYELGRHGEAKEEFFQALVAAEADKNVWAYVVPQIYLNLGIILENEGMVFNACDHYREACILCPTHFRALKFLGSALLAVGEYRAAIKALEEAIFLKRDYVDAYYTLALALLALGDQDQVIMAEFQKVLDLKPDHVDALFSLGELYMDKGWYLRASEMYTTVLAVRPDHWKAQLGKVVSSFGTGESEEANKTLKEALKMADRVELHDQIAYLKQLQKRRLKGDSVRTGEDEAYIIVEPFKFKTAEDSPTSRWELLNALDIRDFQNITRLNRCDLELLKKQMNENDAPLSYSDRGLPEKSIRRASLEGILRKLLGFLKPETFVGAVKAINQKILCVLDESQSGKVDLGLFFAVVAPLCGGHPDKRKRVAYYALLRRPCNEGSTKIRKIDAQRYIKLLRTIYIPSLGASEMLDILEEVDQSLVSLPEFLQMFDDPDRGFGIMSTLLKLETGRRNGSYVCATCHFGIIGSRFKEMKSHFSLCSHCYSECKVPPAFKQEEYIFKEYAN